MLNYNFDNLQIIDILNNPKRNEIDQNNNEDENHKTCEYCKSKRGVIQCQCGRYFCNGTIENTQTCQLIQHMRLNKHFSILLNGKRLKCRSCEQTNIYHFKYSNSTEEVICVECLEKESDEIKSIFKL